MNIETAARQKRRLLLQGATLGGKLALDDQDSFSIEIGASLSSSAMIFYTSCNGFMFDSNRSYIHLWDIVTIVKRRRENYGKPFIGNFAPIGDIMIGSDFFICDLTDDCSPVYLLYECSIVSPSLDGFIEGLLSDRFDWNRIV